jgi:hypothetical protein
MPIISTFYGIIIKMFLEDGGKHNVPHFHVSYEDHNAVIGFDESVLEGSIPENKMKLIRAWIVIHHENLQANWQLIQNGEASFKIEPLK